MKKAKKTRAKIRKQKPKPAAAKVKRDKNGKWLPGQSANPKGMVKGSVAGIEFLRIAIKNVERKKKIKFFEKAVEAALTEPSVMIAILNKLVPNLRPVDDHGVSGEDGPRAIPFILMPPGPKPK